MGKTAVVLIIIGAVLLSFSAYPLFIMLNEMVIGSRVGQQQEIQRIYVNYEWEQAQLLTQDPPIILPGLIVNNKVNLNGKQTRLASWEHYTKLLYDSADAMRHHDRKYERAYQWAGNTIIIRDDLPAGTIGPDSRQISALNITINGKDWSSPAAAVVRPYYLDENRYHGFFGVLRITENGEEMFVFVQRISGTEADFAREEELGWRTLKVDKAGHVREDRFAYADRAERPERVNYVNLSSASPFSLGYHSNVLQGWPNLFFPLLYPWASGLAGLLCLLTGGAWGLIKRTARKNK